MTTFPVTSKLHSWMNPQLWSYNRATYVTLILPKFNISLYRVYLNVTWKYFDKYANIIQENGAYLICDNGYLQWPTLICPFMRLEGNTPLESCFSANVESVSKDVECCFGIVRNCAELPPQKKPLIVLCLLCFIESEKTDHIVHVLKYFFLC